MVFTKYLVFLVTVLFASVSLAQNNEFQQENGFLPSPVKYFKEVQDDQNAAENHNEERGQEARFGFPVNYGNEIQGYNQGGGVGGVYSPVRIDLGGLVLGTVLGLGAVLIVPKLLHIFSPSGGPHGGGYGAPSPYARSETGAENLMSGMTNVLSRIDRALTENNIDSSICLQRAVCSYIQSSPNANLLLKQTTGNSLVNFLVDGSKFKSAIEIGQNGESCGTAYPQCPFSKESIAAGLQSLIANNNVL